MDMDGDGKTDMLARYANGGFDVNLSNGSVWVANNSFSTTLTDTAGWNNANRLFPADVNGDGKWDLLARNSNGTFDIWLSNGTSLTYSSSVTTPYSDSSGYGSGNRFVILDLNGDGKSDFMARGANGGFDVYVSTGTSYSNTLTVFTSYTDSAGFNSGLRFFVVDMNGDRKSDLLARNSNGTFDMWTSNGTTLSSAGSFTSYFTDASGFNSGNRFPVRDVNGDGRTDLIMRYANGAFEIWSSKGTTYSWYSQFASGLTDAAGYNSGLRFF